MISFSSLVYHRSASLLQWFPVALQQGCIYTRDTSLNILNEHSIMKTKSFKGTWKNGLK